MAEEIGALAAEYWDFKLRTGPTWAHLVGDYRHAGEFERVSRAAEDAEIAESREFERRAAALDPERLGTQDRITRDLLGFDAGATADYAATRLIEVAVDPVSGPQASLPVTLPQLTIPDDVVAEAMLSKLEGIARMFRDLGDRHRDGLTRGWAAPRFAVDATTRQIDEWLARPLDTDPILESLRPRLVRDGRADRARAIIEREVRPALAAYGAVLRDEVAPVARPDERPGLAWLPGGDEAYAAAIRLFTTRDRSPEEVHRIGLEQVARLADEYRQLGREALGTDDLETILESLRSDPALHHSDGAEIVTAAEAAMARARAAIPAWFGTLPKADCGVEETMLGPQGFYFPPAQDGTRGGVFFLNTSDPSVWGRFEIESTAFHEGIPGHHLQGAISSELTGLPDFRRHVWVTIYGEGWGLYSERLADEMGLYGTPLDRIGMLANDSLRACRLVVDTGLHALGWTRRQAIDYMVRNSPMREGHVRAEVDRYICSPGQALAYMLGRLEIQRIRAQAEQALGDGFDIREFHDVVLTSGSVLPETLANLVDDWVARRSASRTGTPDAV